MCDMKIIIVIFLFIYTTKCTIGSQKTGGRIVGGELANFGQFPYIVCIESYDLYNRITADLCGGALISNSWVLTAAHCVYGKEYLMIYIGSVFTREFKVAYKVFPHNVRVHYRFQPPITGDIALIRIPETQFCEDIFPVKLPDLTKIHETFEGHYALAMGWGRISTYGPQSRHLRFINQSIISNELCTTYGCLPTPDYLCLDTNNFHSICFGDSGGPLVLSSTQELVGIAVGVSNNGCETGIPNLFARITEYLHWIHAISGIPLHF